MMTFIRLVFFGVIVVVMTGCGFGTSSEEYIARANEFIAESDYDSAIIELKNALQTDKASAQARWLLGKAYLDTGDVLSAEKELRRAQELHWSPADVEPALAQALLAQGKFIEVEALEEELLNAEAEAQLLTSKALAKHSLGERNDAKKYLSRALEKVPEHPEALSARVRILAAEGDLVGAENILEDILARHPEHGPAWSLAGDLAMAQQKYSEALVAFSKAIEFQRNSYGNLVKRAILLVQLADYDAAQTDVTKLLQIAPHHPASNYAQGVLYYQARKFEEAITALSIAEPAFNQFPMLLFFLASAHLIEGNQDQAAVHANHFFNLEPESIGGRMLLATIRLQQGKYQEVEELLQPVIDSDPTNVGALNLLANAQLRDGRTDEGVSLLSRVAALQPDSSVAQVRLGAGLLLGGKSTDAVQHMETALELNPEFQQADILLVLNYLQKKDYPAAIDAAESYKRRNLVSPAPYTLLGRVYLEAGQHDKARQSFEKALTFDAGDPAANHNLAHMAVAEKDLPAARRYYETTLEHRENLLPALIQLAMLDAREGKEELLVSHLEQAIEAHPLAIQPRVILARYYLGKGRPELVSPLFATLDDIQKKSPQVLHVQAMAQLSQRDHGAAKFTLEQLIENSADSAAVHHMMANAAAGSGDVQRTRKELESALALDEKYLPSRIALARLFLAEELMDEFSRELAILVDHAPDNTDVLFLRAVSARSKGDGRAAVEFAERAYTNAPSSATVLTLGSYMNAEHNVDAVYQLYNNWLEEHPDDVGVRLALANGLQLAQKHDEAKLQYVQIVELDPDNIVALNNLAWQLRKENPEKALEYARRASETAPDSPEVLDTLAVVEYMNKDYSRARRSIERALAGSPDNPSLQYHSAMIVAALGEKALAVVTLERLLAGGDDFPEIIEATELLEKLKKK